MNRNKYTLVIVESPGKIKKFKDILGPNYEITTTTGIIVSLDPKKLSVDTTDANFTPTFIASPTKVSVINKIKSMYAKSNGNIIIATDIDRVGESIGNDLLNLLNIDKTIKNRLIFSSITSEEILGGMKNLVCVNQNMVEAEKSRVVIDRLVGYPVSQVLRSKILRTLSAGRVQSPVTKLIVEKEQEITKFIEDPKNNPHFSICIENNGIKNYLSDKKNKRLKLNEIESIEILKKIYNDSFVVSKILVKKKNIKPFPPFTTSTLQQVANKTLGFSPTKTMKHAQRLYESGLITYHRTDSTMISNQANDAISKYISSKYENDYMKRTYSNGINIQGAHECIRASNPFTECITTIGNITSPEVKLYQLIHKRTIMSQMKNAIYDSFSITINSEKNPELFFIKELSVVVYQGHTRLMKKKNENPKIPKIGDKFGVKVKAVELFNLFPPRYSMGTLIKRLDPCDLNIGRPSTYASTIDKIIERKYVEENIFEKEKKNSKVITYDGKNINSEIEIVDYGYSGKYLKPTFLGKRVVEFLNTHFPKIMDYKYTSLMEQDLDLVKDGQKKYVEVVKSIYDYVTPTIAELKKNKVKQNGVIRVLGKDPESGNNINVLFGFYGPYVTMENNKMKKGPINKPYDIETITLDEALKILEFPKLMGKHNDDDILIKKGKYGTYIECGKLTLPYVYTDEPNIDEIMTIINGKKIYFNEDKSYEINNGKYGYYIKVSKFKKLKNGKYTKSNTNIPLGKDVDVKLMTIDKLIEIEKNYVPKKRYISKKKVYKFRGKNSS